jgi:nucleotide-binding universal stress UspA family protein
MADTALSKTLCPLDFSAVSAAALRFARQWTPPTSGRLVAVHADWLDVPPYFTEGQVQELRLQAQSALEQAGRQLGEFVAGTLGDATGVESQVVEGMPATAILDFASRTKADWIVMGTHGRTGWNRWTLGSVAERVIRESPLPVITVRSFSGEPIRQILCPVNDTGLSRAALSTAAAIAARTNATLTVLHVVEPHADRSIANICGWVDAEARAHCTIREVARHGDPAHEIVAMSQAGEFDLVVLGAPRRRFFEGMVLGSTALRVIRHSGCPVLSLPAEQTRSIQP